MLLSFHVSSISTWLLGGNLPTPKIWKAKVIAGGTDLLAHEDRVEGPEMKMPEVLINIKSAREFHHLVKKEHRIGAAVTQPSASSASSVKYLFCARQPTRRRQLNMAPLEEPLSEAGVCTSDIPISYATKRGVRNVTPSWGNIETITPSWEMENVSWHIPPI
jgi:hypothetical protein